MYYVNNMTWGEFCLRLHSYNRQKKNELYNLRFLAYNTIIANYQDPKKIPKTIEAFLPIDNKKDKATDFMKQRIKEAREQFFKQKQNG